MTRIAIVGAGLSGLAAARDLRATGADLVLFEKSRAVGGRLATRRVRDDGPAHGLTFDHGAPGIDDADGAFGRLVAGLADAGHVVRWPGAPQSARWTGQAAMNAALGPLAKGLDIRFQHRALSIVRNDERNSARWRVALEAPDGDSTADADAIIVTAPAPQTAALVRSAAPDIARLAETATMAATWTVMMVLDAAIEGDAFRLIEDHSSPIELMILEHLKPGRAAAPARIVAHARQQWTNAHLEADKYEIADKLGPIICGLLDARNVRPIHAAAHRWRYARAEAPVGFPFLSSACGTLMAAGDWLFGPNASCAFDSGSAAARAMAGRLLSDGVTPR